MTGILLFFLALLFIALFFLLNKSKFFILRRESIEADAIILNIQLTGICTKSGMQAIIQLQVQPERGKSFVIDARLMLSLVAYTKVHQGNKVRVKYNQANTRGLVILKHSLANDTPGK